MTWTESSDEARPVLGLRRLGQPDQPLVRGRVAVLLDDLVARDVLDGPPDLVL